MRQSSLMPCSATPFLNTSRHELAKDQNTAGTWARTAWLSGRGVPSRAQRSNSARMAASSILAGAKELIRGFDIDAFSASSCASKTRRIRFIHHGPQVHSHVGAWPQRDQARSRVVYRAFPPVKPLRPAVRACSLPVNREAQVRCAAADWRGILNHRHLARSHRFVVTAAAFGCFRLGGRNPMLGRRGNTPMGARAARVLLATVACLLWLNGCESSTRLGDLFQSKADTGAAVQDDPATTGSVRPTPRDPPAAAKASPNDDLSRGKKHFQAGNFPLAERHFRRAVELHPRDLESWMGLAASYDRQRRFDLADRAYDQATKIAGP